MAKVLVALLLLACLVAISSGKFKLSLSLFSLIFVSYVNLLYFYISQPTGVPTIAAIGLATHGFQIRTSVAILNNAPNMDTVVAVSQVFFFNPCNVQFLLRAFTFAFVMHSFISFSHVGTYFQLFLIILNCQSDPSVKINHGL